MKKFGMIFLGLATLTLVTGCGGSSSEKTLVCTTSEDMDGMNMAQTVSMTFGNDKMNRLKMDITTKLTDDDLKESWDEFVKSMDSQLEETSKTGLQIKTTSDKKNYEYIVTFDIDLDKVSEEDLEEYDLAEISTDDTLEEVRKSMEEDGLTCKVN